MFTPKRRQLFRDYLDILDKVLTEQGIDRHRHGWKKTRAIVAFYFTIWFVPETSLRKAKSFLLGTRSWENFTGFYFPIVLISTVLFLVGVIIRLLVPFYLAVFHFPVLTMDAVVKIVVVSALWCLLIYIVEYEIRIATEESDLFRLVQKYDPVFRIKDR